MSCSSDDETPQLSSAALEALAEFRLEQERRQLELETPDALVDEDWQLSQFWYAPPTTARLVDECLRATSSTARIACVCTPTVFHALLQYANEHRDRWEDRSMMLFEYDSRFIAKYGAPVFTFYDYNEPMKVPEHMHNYFDYVMVDPPFLADECVAKTSKTVKLIGKSDVKIVMSTGSIMTVALSEHLALHQCAFKPQHSNKLSNEFGTYANYDAKLLMEE